MKNGDMKEKLYNSLIELMYDKPLDKITVRQVAEHCGVTTQTFYNHFSDKYEITHWAYQKRVDRLLKELVEERITFEEFLNQYLADYMYNSRYILNAVANTSGEDSYCTKGGRYFCSAIEREMCLKLKVDELPQDYKLLIKMWVGGFSNLILVWLRNPNDISQEEMVKALVESVPQKLQDIYMGKTKLEK